MAHRVVAIGFARPATGLERVMAHILEAVAEVAEVHWLGLGYRGEVTTQGAVTLHPANVGGGDPFGARGGRDLVDEVGADTVLLYNDLWFLEKYKRLFATPRDVRVIAYCPLDGRIVDPVLGDMVSWVDDVVVFSDFARREFEHIGVGPVHVIGHGVDDVAFRPVPRADARAMLPAGWDDAFVVLNANRLQPRKRIDVTVDAFAEFAATRPRARLFLHHALEGMGDEVLLDKQLASLDLGDRVHVSRDEFSNDDLNRLYGACDVGVNTSCGEGWGLVSFEHALTGAAQVVPRNSACEELWEGAAELVDPVSKSMSGPSLLEMADVAPADVAAALGRLHDDPDHLERRSGAARSRANESRFTWAEVGRQWRALLTE